MKLILKYKNLNFISSIFIVLMFQLIFELYIYNKSLKNKFLFGDFFLYNIEANDLYIPLILSIISIILQFLILYLYLTFSKKNQNYPVGTNYYIILLFFIYFLIFVSTEMGFTSSKKSYFGILISILPPTFLIIFLSIKDWNFKFLICLILFTLMYYINGILIGLFTVLWIIFFKLKLDIKKFFLLLFFFPLSLIIINQVIDYKFKKRGGDYALNQFNIENHLISRFAINQNLTYINLHKTQISLFCKNNYLNQYQTAIYQIIPKKIFNLGSPKTINNCVLDFYLNSESLNSSIKTSFVGNVILISEKNNKNALFYILFVIILLLINALLINTLLGKKGYVYLFYLMFIFFMDGSIGLLSHSIFFLSIVVLYFSLMKPFYIYSND